MELPDLFDKDKMVALNNEKLTLIDFWEVWCGACVRAFPKVEDIKNKYKSDLMVIGIVSENQERAIELVQKKGATFQNLVGNTDLRKMFDVHGWPTYFLVDKNGIVQNEYSGFSDQIEKDVQRLINE
ncbi:TlpA family protein disulfide reductase [Flagellimonas sp.]|uniref:TlpA family protein disulfide reductase n=1 Tax=Flagellimonas sp. TaxID=2058762 RepID=UPI003F4A7513